MNCPRCGKSGFKHRPTGRPKKLDDRRVLALFGTGLSLRDIADHMKVTHGAIQASLKRSDKTK